MATTSQGVDKLYSDINADLIPYFMDAVLLPNQSIIRNTMSVAGTTGDSVKYPLTNAYTPAADVAEGGLINATTSDFAPQSVTIIAQKRGVATDVHEEALEDGGFDVVRSAVLNRLAGGLAEATDVAGLLVAADGSDTTLCPNTGATSTASTHAVNLVMSPDALSYMEKRAPGVKVWYNPNRDMHEFRGTVRNGFAALRGNFINQVISNKTVGSADANLESIAKAVAQLRAQNAPTDIVSGQYVSIIDPALEFDINKDVALNGGSAIGSLSDVGNRALLQGLIGQIAGVMLFRSNNLPTADQLS
jgi:hypothetical protein